MPPQEPAHTDSALADSELTLFQRRRRRRLLKRSFFWRFRRLFFMGLLLVVAAMAGVGLVLSSIALPETSERLAETSFICTREVKRTCTEDNATFQLNGEVNRTLVSYSDLPDVLIDAVIAGEDQDFFDHNGIDPVGIARAAWVDVSGRGEVVQGGSTITQQYVKNVFLTNERSLVRKLKEAVLSVKLEKELEKEEILERYLNTVYFGRGAYGVEAASDAYFGKSVGELSVADAAYLTGLLRAPEGADAETDPDEATFRRNSVLDNMLEEGYIDEARHRKASAQPWKINPFGLGNLLPRIEAETLGQVKGREYGTEYFAELVRQQLVELFGESQAYGGGLRVYTTLDHDWQRAAYETVVNTLNPEDPAASIVAVGPRGRVRAMMGGRNFTESQVNLAVGAAGGGSGRQPGSSFKPFALTEALRQGYSANAALPAPSTKTFELPDNGGDWVVTAGGGQASMDLLTATQHSNNVVYAGLMLELGTQNVLNTANDLGVSSTLPPVPSIVLGAGEVSVLDMASAYTTFREHGTRYPPVIIEKVEDSEGKLLWEPEVRPKQVLDEQVADTVTHALERVVQGGTGSAAAIGRPAAGKTGTTDDNKDAWFVGYTCNVTAAVWMGYSGADGTAVRPMANVQGIQVQGGTFPAQMWRDFMNRINEFVPDDCAFTNVTDFPGELKFDVDLTTSTTGSTTTTSPTKTTKPPATTVAPTTTIAPPTTGPPPPGGGGGGP